MRLKTMTLLMLSTGALASQLAHAQQLPNFTGSEDVPVTTLPSISTPQLESKPATAQPAKTEPALQLLTLPESPLTQLGGGTLYVHISQPVIDHSQDIPILQMSIDNQTLQAQIFEFSDHIIPVSVQAPPEYLQIEQTMQEPDTLDQQDIPVGLNTPPPFSVTQTPGWDSLAGLQEHSLPPVQTEEKPHVVAQSPSEDISLQNLASRIPLVLPIVQASLSFVVSAENDHKANTQATQAVKPASPAPSPSGSLAPETVATGVNLPALQAATQAANSLENTNMAAQQQANGSVKPAEVTQNPQTDSAAVGNSSSEATSETPQKAGPSAEQNTFSPASTTYASSKLTGPQQGPTLQSALPTTNAQDPTLSAPSIYVFGKANPKVLYEKEFLFYPEKPLGTPGKDQDLPTWLKVRMVFVMTPDGKHQINYSLVNANPEGKEILFTETSSMNLLFNGEPLQASLSRANTSQIPGYLKPLSGEYGTIKLPDLESGRFEIDWELLSAGLAPRTYRLHMSWDVKRWKVHTNKGAQ